VYVRITADANPVGGFRASADSGEAVLLTGAAYRSTAGIAGLALLEINLPTSGAGA
jgi:hypothetical protein